MLECYKTMSRQFVSRPDVLKNIRAELREQEDEKINAYYCSLPSFIDIYRLAARRSERNGQPFCLMLCTITDYEGKVIQNQEKLKARSELLRKTIGRRSGGATFTPSTARPSTWFCLWEWGKRIVWWWGRESAGISGNSRENRRR